MKAIREPPYNVNLIQITKYFLTFIIQGFSPKIHCIGMKYNRVNSLAIGLL